MNYEKLEQLTSNLRIILNLIRDYNQQFEILNAAYQRRFESMRQNELTQILTKLSNCEAQIKFNEDQYKQTINQINELLQ